MSDEQVSSGIKWGKTLYPKNKTEKVAIIENFLYENDTMCIQGESGAGKSVLVKEFITDLTMGSPLWGIHEIARPCKVCYIQTEGDEEETYERLDNMKVAKRINDDNWAYLFEDGVEINTSHGFEHLKNELVKPQMNFDVIILDPLYTSISGSLNDVSVAGAWIRNMRKLKRLFSPCAVIVVHHLAKPIVFKGKMVDKAPGSIIGSFAWKAFFNTVYDFTWDKSKNIRHLNVGKSRSNKVFKKMALKMIEPRPLYFSADGEDTTNSYDYIGTYIRTHDKVTRRQLLDQFTSGKEFNFSEMTVDRGIKFHKNNKNIERIRFEGQWWYRWV